MASNGSPLRQQPHVPAWKRLGLKLKYAKEDAGHDSPYFNPVETFRSSIGHSPEEQNSNDDQRPFKKRRTSSEEPNVPQHSVANGVATESPAEEAPEQLQGSSDTGSPMVRTELQYENRDLEPVSANQ